ETFRIEGESFDQRGRRRTLVHWIVPGVNYSLRSDSTMYDPRSLRMTYAERRAEAAESELREVLILQFLEGKVGEELEGVITGVTNFGIFVQVPRFLIEGLVHIEALGDDWWEVNPRYGFLRGERTGRTFHVGRLVKVRIAAVDAARRQLILELAKLPGAASEGARRGKKTDVRRREGPVKRERRGGKKGSRRR
ncbi:MAG: S1 RNA-binding domain-containing protein, partial [Planctomycetes bacterium]|nr:S1 RNA-binding domain-containing protein [Planctomycetota bacterium]